MRRGTGWRPQGRTTRALHMLFFRCESIHSTGRLSNALCIGAMGHRYYNFLAHEGTLSIEWPPPLNISNESSPLTRIHSVAQSTLNKYKNARIIRLRAGPVQSAM